MLSAAAAIVEADEVKSTPAVLWRWLEARNDQLTPAHLWPQHVLQPSPEQELKLDLCRGRRPLKGRETGAGLRDHRGEMASSLSWALGPRSCTTP